MKTLHALFLFGLFFFAMPAFAQLPADQGFLIKAELDKRGLSEAEADAALIAEGLDINAKKASAKTVDQRNNMTVLTSRALKKAQYIAENAARGKFPDPKPIALPEFDYADIYKRIRIARLKL